MVETTYRFASRLSYRPGHEHHRRDLRRHRDSLPQCGHPAGRGCQANSGRPTTAHKDRIGRAELLAHTGVPDVWLCGKLDVVPCGTRWPGHEHARLVDGRAVTCPGLDNLGDAPMPNRVGKGPRRSRKVEAASAEAVTTAHTMCYLRGTHAKTPAARAACRKTRATA